MAKQKTATLGELKTLLPIPDSPIDVDESILKKNVKSLKVELPTDYLAYGRVYGSGTISVKAYNFEIYSAFRPSLPKFVKSFFDIKDAFRQAMETFDVDIGLFPEPGGLLPFGNRDDLYFTWKTEGNPDDWKVVVMWAYDHDGYKKYDMNVTTWLASVLTRKVKVPGWNTSWNPKTDISFETEVFGD